MLSATLKQDFRLGIFHLDNEVTWQKTSNETVLPLPQLSLYHNFYILAKLAKKVLTVQLGADVRYFTKYKDQRRYGKRQFLPGAALPHQSAPVQDWCLMELL